MKPKRILMIATSYHPTIGGLENYMKGLATRLAEKGYKITIQTIWIPGTKECEYFKNIEIRRTRIPNISGTRQLFWFWAVLKSIYKDRKDIDIIHAYPMFMTGLFAAIIGKLIDKPIVIREGMSSSLLDKVLNVPLIPTMARYMVRNSTIYVNNPETINMFKRVGIPTKTMKIIRTPIDTSVFKPVEEKEKKKRKLGINSNFTLLYVGRFIGWKNVDLLIESIPNLIPLIPNLNLVLVGNGPDKDKLIQLAEELNISNHIYFTGFIPQSEVHNYFQIADVFVTMATHAKSNEIYSHPDTTIYQAMACGIPIISPPDMQGLSDNQYSNISAFAKVDTGIIIDTNPVSFYNAVIYLYENPDIAYGLGTNGRNIVVKKLDWDKHITKIEKIYKEII